LGGAPIGSLAVLAQGLDDALLQSIANLSAIGLERARSQEAAAQGEAARQSGELRAAVLDALAHEFKTPLTSALAAASDLASSTTLSERHQELVSILDEELERLRSLVTDAVRTLRVDAGDFVVHRERHTLSALVATALARVAARLDGRPIANRVPPDITVEAARDLIEMALVQLVDNAVKYSPPGSDIAIDAVERKDTGSVTLSVTNAGAPIDEAERSRIFERFYRGSQAQNIPGTGLGLAIVRKIAAAHGGTVSVESNLTGTTFTLSLPRRGRA
jgi:two-component system sensor histidine kinase KdpD